MLKYLMIPVAAALIAGFAYPLASNIASGGDDQGARLVEATDRSRNKAQSMRDTFAGVIPPAHPAGIAAGAAAGAAGAATGQSPAGQLGPPATPTPHPYARYEHAGDHAVAKAITNLAKLQQLRTNCPAGEKRSDCVAPLPTHFEIAIENLHDSWAPRYAKAVEEHKRFKYRIDRTNEIAAEYFDTQWELTSQLPPDQQERWRANDAAERQIYQEWNAQAHKAVTQADQIMNELRAMNIIITKQRLSAQFAAIYSSFVTLPMEITILYDELERFQAESDRIQATFGAGDN